MTIFRADSDCGRYTVAMDRHDNRETATVYTVDKAANKLVDMNLVFRLPCVLLAPYLVDVATRLAHRKGYADAKGGN